MITKAELDRITGHLRAGQTKSALKLCKTGMKRNPKEPAFLHLAGTALSQAGNPREGAQYFLKALKLAPGKVATQDNLVGALVHSGQFDKARPLIHKFLKDRPDDPHLLYQLAALEYQACKSDEVQKALDRCIEILTAKRNSAQNTLLMRARSLRGRHHLLLWDNTAAKQDFEAAFEIAPNDPKIMANLASCMTVEMKNDEALELLERAQAINPGNIELLMQYAIQLNQMGRREEAVEIYEGIVERNPNHPNALLQLANSATGEHAPSIAKQLKSAYHKSQKNSYDQGKIAFALAKNYEKSGERGEANNWYETGNRIIAEWRPYDAKRSLIGFQKVTELFPVGQKYTAQSKSEGAVPVFVIGQPRSGTTLTEMILSAHPDIAGVGEQTIAGSKASPFVKGEAHYSPEQAAAFANAYRADLPDLPEGASRFVDKMPGNYQYVGFLLTAFPNAVILNICRDPRDVAWSMWRVHFPALGLNYTFDMAAMAQEANLYKQYINHWKNVFPGQIHDVQYEDLVGDIEGQSRRLADLCKVEWVPEMAQPERNKAPVRTASLHQVREKVNTRSIGGWKANEQLFVPFMETLDPALWPEAH